MIITFIFLKLPFFSAFWTFAASLHNSLIHHCECKYVHVGPRVAIYRLFPLSLSLSLSVYCMTIHLVRYLHRISGANIIPTSFDYIPCRTTRSGPRHRKFARVRLHLPAMSSVSLNTRGPTRALLESTCRPFGLSLRPCRRDQKCIIRRHRRRA